MRSIRVVLPRVSLVVLLALVVVGCNVTAATPTPTSAPPVATAAPPPTATKPAVPLATPSDDRPIVVGEPQAQQKVKSPVHVAGLARVYEGTVRFEVVDSRGTVLGQGFTTATAGGPEVGSFAADLTFTPPPSDEAGVVHVFGDDPRDGTKMGLVEIPVMLAAGNPAQTLDLQVYFTKTVANEAQYVPVARTIPYTQGMARAAILELLKGPTEAEKQSGLGTAIPAEAQLKSVRIDNGTAYADFAASLGEGVGGALQTTAIRQQITLTLQQFSTVQDVVISIEGQTEDILQP